MFRPMSNNDEGSSQSGISAPNPAYYGKAALTKLDKRLTHANDMKLS